MQDDCNLRQNSKEKNICLQRENVFIQIKDDPPKNKTAAKKNILPLTAHTPNTQSMLDSFHLYQSLSLSQSVPSSSSRYLLSSLSSLLHFHNMQWIYITSQTLHIHFK